MVEIERKYIIELPRLDLIKSIDGCTESEILQIYINSQPGVTKRVRRREFSDRVVYTKTQKLRINKMSAEEDEREISENEFNLLSAQIKEGTRPIIKTRYTFYYLGKPFEIDVYPEWRKSAILETELTAEDEAVDFPEVIHVIKEVTGDPAYSNAGMARHFPEEETYNEIR